MLVGWLSERAVIGAEPGFQPTAIEMWGSVGNWDLDAEPDGWIVQLRWVHEGRVIEEPVEPLWRNDWVAHFQWTPIARNIVGDRVPAGGKKEMQWTVRLDPQEMLAKLPFRGNKVKWEECGSGVLTVRVAVPGVGVVENAIIIAEPHPFLVDTDRNYR